MEISSGTTHPARLMAALIALGLCAAPAAGQPAPPQRVVSINLCTDQLALLLAGTGQMKSVSYMATRAQASLVTDLVGDLVTNRAQVEEILMLEPDLILAGSFNDRATVALLRRLGLRVEEFAPATSFAEVRSNALRMGHLLGQNGTAEAAIAQFDRELERLSRAAKQRGARPRAAFFDSNSFTFGQGTLIDELLEVAGFANIARELDLVSASRLTLERLVLARPDVLVLGGQSVAPARANEVLRHPVLRRLKIPTTVLPNVYRACGTPRVLEAVDHLVRLHVQSSGDP